MPFFGYSISLLVSRIVNAQGSGTANAPKLPNLYLTPQSGSIKLDNLQPKNMRIPTELSTLRALQCNLTAASADFAMRSDHRSLTLGLSPEEQAGSSLTRLSPTPSWGLERWLSSEDCPGRWEKLPSSFHSRDGWQGFGDFGCPGYHPDNTSLEDPSGHYGMFHLKSQLEQQQFIFFLNSSSVCAQSLEEL